MRECIHDNNLIVLIVGHTILHRNSISRGMPSIQGAFMNRLTVAHDGPEFGNGITSAIDFKTDLQREDDPNGDRVRIVMSCKFLPYKQY